MSATRNLRRADRRDGQVAPRALVDLEPVPLSEIVRTILIAGLVGGSFAWWATRRWAR